MYSGPEFSLLPPPVLIWAMIIRRNQKPLTSISSEVAAVTIGAAAGRQFPVEFDPVGGDELAGQHAGDARRLAERCITMAKKGNAAFAEVEGQLPPLRQEVKTLQQKLATAFHRNHPVTIEGGVIDEEYRTEYVVDRVVTTSTVWLGLTMTCGRCHDHKYDPISQRDYYHFYSFFDQSSETGRGRSGGVLAPSMRFVPDADERAEAREVLADRPVYVTFDLDCLDPTIAPGVSNIEPGEKGFDIDEAALQRMHKLAGMLKEHFGSPARITATTRLGEGEMVDIERETELGGPIHSKGVFILASFVGARYSRNVPLSLSASLTIEQS